jgi:thioredoxin reductase
MIAVDSNGYILTKEFNETTIIPKIYAIGGCVKNGSKTRLLPIINHLIELNNFKKSEE